MCPAPTCVEKAVIEGKVSPARNIDKAVYRSVYLKGVPVEELVRRTLHLEAGPVGVHVRGWKFMSIKPLFIAIVTQVIHNFSNRVVQKLQFLNNKRLKTAKCEAFCLDLFDNQPGYRTSPMENGSGRIGLESRFWDGAFAD
jgi:hypothetical protein